MPEKPEFHLGERPVFRGIAVYLQNQIQADIINPCDKNDTSMIVKKNTKTKRAIRKEGSKTVKRAEAPYGLRPPMT